MSAFAQNPPSGGGGGTIPNTPNLLIGGASNTAASSGISPGSVLQSAAQFGLKGDGTTDNSTALAAMATYLNANPNSQFFFPCGNYVYSTSPQVTVPFALYGNNCAIMNYTGTGNAFVVGASNLTTTVCTSSNVLNCGQYKVDGFSWIGGSSATNGIYVMPYATDPVISNNDFWDFTVSTNTLQVGPPTYSSGVTGTGTGTCIYADAGGFGGSGARIQLSVTAGVVSTSTIVLVSGTNYSSEPTSWTYVSGAACSGTATTTGGTLQPAYQVVLAQENWHADVYGNHFHNLTIATGRNGINAVSLSTQNGTQLRIHDNLMTGQNLGIGIRANGAAQIYYGNKIESQTPDYLIDGTSGQANTMGTSIINSYMECGGSACIEFKGTATGIEIRDNYANTHNSTGGGFYPATNRFVAPFDGSSVMNNSDVSSNTIVDDVAEIVTLNCSTDKNLRMNGNVLLSVPVGSSTPIQATNLSNCPTALLLYVTQSGTSTQVSTQGAASNYVLYSEPVVNTTQLVSHSTNAVNSAVFTAATYQLSNGIAIPTNGTPGSTELDYAYAPCQLTAGTYNISAYVIMLSGNAPVPGANSSGFDFYFLLGGNGIPASTYTTTQIQGSLYRVSASGTAGSGGSNTTCGVVRNTAQSGNGFSITGFQVSSTLQPYTKTTGNITSSTAANTWNYPAIQATSINSVGSLNASGGGFVPALQLYRIGENGNAWTINGSALVTRSSASAVSGVTQTLTLLALPANSAINYSRIKTETACAGTGTGDTLTATVGDTANASLLLSSYNLLTAASGTNISQSTTPGPDTAAATNLTISITLTSPTAGTTMTTLTSCVLDVWVNWGNLYVPY